MKRYLFLLLILVFNMSLFSQTNNVRFMSDPSLSPDGNTILFCYEGDIWKCDVSGGTAYRITAMEGAESLPRYSPDGKYIAFSGNQDGNANVYIVSAGGGEIKQISYHSSFDNVDSWSWDSQYIYFTSGRENGFSSYRAGIDGDTPERLFSDHYWDNTHFVVEDPLSDAYYFSESRESFRSNNRKRYKGENNPDIKLYNPLSGEFNQLTNYEGKDLWPAVDKSGMLYFASDESNGEYNLYTVIDGSKKVLTSFESSIGRPQVSANGSTVVFIMDYRIHSYDVETGEVQNVPVNTYANQLLEAAVNYNTDAKISSFDVSSDNRKMVFVSRGKLFVSDIKGKFIKNIKTDESERVIEAKWIKDNSELLIIMTNGGWPNVYRYDISADKGMIALNAGEKKARMLNVNKDRTKAVYYSGKDELRMLDLTSFEDKLLLKDEFWFRGSTPGFSPDDRYIYFTAYRHFEQDILVYDLKESKKINLTDTYLTERDPFWSPDGRYMYFVADRSKASYPRGGADNRLYRLPLQKYSEPFRSDEIEKIMQKKKADDRKGGKKDNKKGDPKEEAAKAGKAKILSPEIDTDNLLFRWETPLSAGPQQSRPYVICKDTITYVLFGSTHEGKRAFYKLTLNPYEKSKTEAIKGLNGGTIVNAGKKYYALSGGKVYEINIKSNKAELIKTNFNFTKDLSSEFKQMFYEAWTILAENYYDVNMHGVAWKAMRTKYEKFLPFVRSRNDLRILLNDMLGELNSSHMGFSSRGDEESNRINNVTAGSGIIFSSDNPFMVKRIVAMSPADNIYSDIQSGDVIISVNGQTLEEGINREKYFTNPKMPEELRLGILRNGKEHITKIHPVGARNINGLLYDEWIEVNEDRVDKMTDNKVGYVYLKNMSGSSLNKFIIEMTSEEVEKEALIVDLRYNTGGNIHDDVLKFLSQKPYLNWKFREGMLSPQPHFAPSGKPIIILINEQSLSDAEMTSAGFKELGLGTIVGTETYRWIIFTSSARLVDGSTVRLPAWGCYTLDGTDLEFSGVAPDVYVKNSFTDKLKGDDPQLIKAIELILEEL